jgi:peptidoglycan/LPS O-acetylase OafA/YrhL
MSKSSNAINNLRGSALLMIVAFHSCTAYLSALPATQPKFDVAPYAWLASPIVDQNRFIGIDIFCALLFLQLMQVMFFVSGLFVWRSIERKGGPSFLADRALRLALPFVLGMLVLMPLTYYAVFRLTAVDPSFTAFIHTWLSLPFWPSGPMWFLWFLLALDVAALAIFRLRRDRVSPLLQWAGFVRRTPMTFFIALVAVSLVLYLPLARIFTPWDWRELGPFSLQPLLAPQYALYFFAGVLVGSADLDKGLLRAGGSLTLHARRWATAALVGFVAWLAAMGIITQRGPAPVVQFLADILVVLYAASALVGLLGCFLKFIHRERPLLAAIASNGYGVYFFHYFFVLWTQYLLLGVSLLAVIKVFAVFAVSLSLSWIASELVCTLSVGRRILRGERRVRAELPRAAE